MTQLFDTEQTPEGRQALVPGVAPVTERDRLERRMQAPLAGGSAPCNKGLFDEGARNQLDMLDII